MATINPSHCHQSTHAWPAAFIISDPWQSAEVLSSPGSMVCTGFCSYGPPLASLNKHHGDRDTVDREIAIQSLPAGGNDTLQ